MDLLFKCAARERVKGGDDTMEVGLDPWFIAFRDFFRSSATSSIAGVIHFDFMSLLKKMYIRLIERIECIKELIELLEKLIKKKIRDVCEQ